MVIKSINFSIAPDGGGKKKKNAYKYKVTKDDLEKGEKGFAFEADLVSDGKPGAVIFEGKIKLEGSGPPPDPEPCKEGEHRDPVTGKCVPNDPDPDPVEDGDKLIAFSDNDVTNGAEQVLTQIMKEPRVAQYLFIGDGPYSTEGTQWTKMMGEYFDDAKKQKLMLSQGNHDDKESESEQTQVDIEDWFGQELQSNKWLTSKQVGNSYIISMNSQDLDVEFERDQFAWVKAELATAKQLRSEGKIKWIVVLFHKPFFTLKSSHSPYTAVRFMYGPIFRDAQVDFVIHGHNHNTQLWLPMIPNESQANGEGSQLFSLKEDGKTFDFEKEHGALYIICGHGGHEHNEINDSGSGVKNVMYYNDTDYGYSCIVLNQNEATVQAKNTSGKVLFQYKVARGQNAPPVKKPVVSITYSPERPKAGETVNLDGSKSKAGKEGSTIEGYEWSADNIPLTDANKALASFQFPDNRDSVNIKLYVVDSDGQSNERTVTITKFIEEELDAEAELLITKKVGDTVILDGSRSKGNITRFEWNREDNSGVPIILEPAPGNLKYSLSFKATEEMVDKDIKYRLRVFDAAGLSDDDVGGTKVTINKADTPGENVLWDSNIHLKTGQAYVIDGTHGSQAANGKGVFMAASGDPRLKVDADGTFHLEADPGHGRVYIKTTNHNARLSGEINIESPNINSCTLRLRSRHNMGGDCSFRFGGFGCSIYQDEKTYEFQTESCHNNHENTIKGNWKTPWQIGKWYKFEYDCFDSADKKSVNFVLRVDHQDGKGMQEVLKGTHNSPKPYYMDEALHAKESYAWLRINNDSETASVGFRNVKITKL